MCQLTIIKNGITSTILITSHEFRITIILDALKQMCKDGLIDSIGYIVFDGDEIIEKGIIK